MTGHDVWVRAQDGTVLAFGRIPAEWWSGGELLVWANARAAGVPGPRPDEWMSG